ncbi:MAG: CcmD family protein [Bacteroidia bacterium]|nr:CcmD family protein [Bacteroidia bacterium]
MKKIIALLTTIFISIYAIAQEAICPEPQQKPEMADLMRSNGKIYVVVTCLLIVFTCVVVYLISLDKRLSKLERNE